MTTKDGEKRPIEKKVRKKNKTIKNVAECPAEKYVEFVDKVTTDKVNIPFKNSPERLGGGRQIETVFNLNIIPRFILS